MSEKTVEFFGETFTLRPKVSEWALMKFAKAAASGADGDTMQGMAAMLNLIEKCIDPEDWPRFDRLADEKDASAADLMPVIQATFEATTERPTGRSSDSSDGPTVIEPKSESNSVDRGLERLAGRPDLQLAVMKVREAQSA